MKGVQTWEHQRSSRLYCTDGALWYLAMAVGTRSLQPASGIEGAGSPSHTTADRLLARHGSVQQDREDFTAQQSGVSTQWPPRSPRCGHRVKDLHVQL